MSCALHTPFPRELSLVKGDDKMVEPWIVERLKRMKSQNNFFNLAAAKIAFRGLLGVALLPVLPLTLATPDAHATMQATRVASGLVLPLQALAAPRDRARVFVVEQGGKIKIFDLATQTILPTPYLDLTSVAGQGQGTGILGMTFDPNYKTNGYFYVSYTTSSGGTYNMGISYVSRFKVTSDPNVADPASEVKVISVDQPQHDHNFDWIGFSNRVGDDGNLYISSGDGGNTEDMGTGHIEPGGNAQNLTTLLGKMLRIHINSDGTYSIPANNPFAGAPPPTKQEIFCYGLRNPFRASFDAATGDLLIGDVGEHTREEIDVNRASNPGGGENFGWRVREGTIQNPFYPDDPPPPNAVDPIVDYDHGVTGSCVLGGFNYQGRKVIDLKKKYIFADFAGPGNQFAGHVFTMQYKSGKAKNLTDVTSQLFPTLVGGYNLGPATSVGQDGFGEVYIVDYTGQMFRIDPAP
jgi:glucose/arabinose dehydrogenase